MAVLEVGRKIAEGAEAAIYEGRFLNLPVIIKVRTSKKYRDPKYDKLFRLTRTKIEARVMAELREAGLSVPHVLLVDFTNYSIVMTYIEGEKMLESLERLSDERACLAFYALGSQVAAMHKMGIYHGDLTPANVIVDSRGEIHLIDFGLSGYSRDVEEYAIDLHLLNRSLKALIPERASSFMSCFMNGYSAAGADLARRVFERVREVERRGRYVEERLRRVVRRESYEERS